MAAGIVPEIGQLVEVRGRNWLVTESIPSSLPPDVLAGETERQHLLSLSSVEDDALSEELRVVWEAEVGRRIRHRATLPDVTPSGFDHPATLAAFLDAVRWGAVTSAEGDTLQAPFRAGITIEDYQLEPLVRALGQPRVNLLIADDVGIGKTIEAGLVAQELLLRHRVRRVMVVCPATLTLKWKAETAEKFGLDFTIVDSARMRELRRSHGIAANPFRVYPLTIVSLQWLPGARVQRLLDEVLPATPTYPRAFDLLIVDEAQHVAPKAPKADYAVDSLQTKAMRRLAQHFEHRLFLSATPHNGYRESWTALLAMVDPLRFARGVEPDDAAKREVVVRRMKDAIRNADGTRRFPERRVEALEVVYSDVEREAHRLLQAFADSRRTRAGAAAVRRGAVNIATLLLKKRLFSSPIAFAKTISHYAGTLRRKKRDEPPPPVAAAPPSWLAQLELAGEEEADDEARTEAEHDQLSRVGAYDTALTKSEDELLAGMIKWAERYGDRPDAKALRLIAYLGETCRPDEKWNDERVVVFTEYRDTQRWLTELLASSGLGGERLKLLFGGQDEKEREQIKNAFQAEPWRSPVRILLATDAAGEGIDLQLHCHRVVNYDIPFNPNRLEQRIGRIDRHGQRHQPEAYHFVGAGWEKAPSGSYERDLEFLARVARKVATQAEDLGSINSVLEAAIQQHMLGALPVDFDPIKVEAKPAAKMLRAELNLRERVDTLGRRLRQSIEDLHVSPANIERVVSTALSVARQPQLKSVPDPKDHGTGLFSLPVLSGSWARSAAGLEDPFSGELRPITFDQGRAADRQDVVLAHLAHPLVAMSTRLLRAAVWGSEHGGLHRVSACLSDDDALEAVVLAAYSRLVLVGADGMRLHEEVFASGGWLRDGRFATIRRVGQLTSILDRALGPDGTRPVAEALQARLAAEWERAREALAATISNRASEREQSLRNRLETLRRDETTRIDDTIGQFRRTLERALADPGTEQLQLRLYQEDERAQLRRDIDTWRSTLETLEGHRLAEIEQIDRRYADVRALTFPAAIVFVVPPREARAP
jgi:superfamily II DNA or RNA helicase